MQNKSNSLHLKRLEEKEIVIEEIYKYPKDNTIFIRTTDGKENDSVYKSPKIEKNFYYKDKLLFREKNFDQETTYTILATKGEKIHKCSECGYEDYMKNFFSGCPYCGANFSIDYSKHKSYGRSIKELFSFKWVKTLCIGIPIIAAIFAIYLNQDFETIFTSIISIPILMFATYLLIMIFYTPYILYKTIIYKDVHTFKIQYNGQIINNAKLLKDVQTTLLNDYYDEKLYPENKDLVDFDILDFENYYYKNINNNIYIVLRLKIRKYLNKNKKIKRVVTKEHIMVYQNPHYIEKSLNLRKCPSCGANVPPLKKKCVYCKNILPSTTLWLIEKS